MKIDDISVSRTHLNLLIDKQNKKIKIRDKFSKFGTGVLVQNKKLNINENLILYIQIGNNILKLIKKLSCCCLFFSCLGNNKLTAKKWNLIYGKQNKESIVDIQNIENLKYNENFSENNSYNSNGENNSIINIETTKNNYFNEDCKNYLNKKYCKLNKRYSNIIINSISESENRELNNNIEKLSNDRKYATLYNSGKHNIKLKLINSGKNEVKSFQ